MCLYGCMAVWRGGVAACADSVSACANAMFVLYTIKLRIYIVLLTLGNGFSVSFNPPHVLAVSLLHNSIAPSFHIYHWHVYEFIVTYIAEYFRINLSFMSPRRCTKPMSEHTWTGTGNTNTFHHTLKRPILWMRIMGQSTAPICVPTWCVAFRLTEYFHRVASTSRIAFLFPNFCFVFYLAKAYFEWFWSCVRRDTESHNMNAGPAVWQGGGRQNPPIYSNWTIIKNHQ